MPSSTQKWKMKRETNHSPRYVHNPRDIASALGRMCTVKGRGKVVTFSSSPGPALSNVHERVQLDDLLARRRATRPDASRLFLFLFSHTFLLSQDILLFRTLPFLLQHLEKVKKRDLVGTAGDPIVLLFRAAVVRMLKTLFILAYYLVFVYVLAVVFVAPGFLILVGCLSDDPFMKIHKELLSLNEKVLMLRKVMEVIRWGWIAWGTVILFIIFLGYVAGVVKSSFALGGVAPPKNAFQEHEYGRHEP
jgi:hypothetical protein